MKIVLQNLHDLSARALELTSDDASASASGWSPSRRVYVVADADGELGLFGGLFDSSLQGWRNGLVEEYDDDGDVVFTGLVVDVSRSTSGASRRVRITADSSLSAIARKLVVEGTAKAVVASATQAPGSELVVVSGSGTISTVASLSWTDQLVPSYAVKTRTAGAGADATLRLDRGLAEGVSAGQRGTLLLPRVETPAELLRRALFAAQELAGQSDRLDIESFESVGSRQATAGALLSAMAARAHKISIADYCSLILKMTGTFLSETSAGKISYLDGPGWEAGSFEDELDASDVLRSAPIEESYANRDNPFYYGYNVPYLSGSVVKIESRELGPLDPYLLRDGADEPFEPLPVPSEAGGYSLPAVIYADLTSARYYANRGLSYYKINRKRLAFSIPLRRSDGSPYVVRQWAPIRLTLPDYGLSRAPVRITKIERDRGEKRIRLQVEVLQ